MEYVFLIVAAAWSLQFLLSYRQLQLFHRKLAEFRKLGRSSVGMDGNRWRGRTYGVLVVDAHERVRHAATFSGVTVFSTLKPITELDGMQLETILTTDTPPAGLRQPQWRALKHAAQFFKQSASTTTSFPGSQLDQRA